MEKRPRIIVIDDNANDLAVTRRFLERHGYDVSAAHSGEEGLDIASKIIPDAFVVDYRMPIMDGFEVARRIKADPQLRNTPVLMLTGAEAAQHVVEGLGAGADDYVTKGSAMEVLFARLAALLRVKAYQDQLRRLNAQMMRDLDIARRVQEALVPPSSFMSPQLDIRSAYIPSEALSGDFYDYFAQNGTMYLFLADVSGHGLPAAILVSLLKSYIHTEADPDRSLAEFMSRLNDFLFSVSLPTQFATAQLFRIDERSRNLVYANAAHPPFLLHKRENRETLVYEQPSNLLGAMPNMPFEEHTLAISPGDMLFAYTDGLTDRRNANGEFYSIDRVAKLLEGSDGDLNQLYDAIYKDVKGFSATDELRDDIAFVVSRFN